MKGGGLDKSNYQQQPQPQQPQPQEVQQIQQITQESFKVLHQSPHRNKCNDWIWIIPFLALLTFAAFFGIRGLNLVRDPAAFCNLIPHTALDNALPSSPGGSNVYDGCVHYIVIGDIKSARSHCVVYAVSILVGGGSGGNGSNINHHAPSSSPIVNFDHMSPQPPPGRSSLLPFSSSSSNTNKHSFWNRQDTKQLSVSASSSVSNSLANAAADATKSKLLPRSSAAVQLYSELSGSQLDRRATSVSLPAIIQQVFTTCITYLIASQSNGPQLCLQYALGTVLGAANTIPFMAKCITPILTNSPTATASCIDFSITALFPTSQIPTIFSTCTGLNASTTAINPQTSLNSVQTCLANALNTTTTSSPTFANFINNCISPALQSMSASHPYPSQSSIPGCVSSAAAALATQATTKAKSSSSLSTSSSSLAHHKRRDVVSTASSALAFVMADTCLSPYLNGTINAFDAASRAIELVLSNNLGVDQVFQLITSAVSSVLGANLGDVFNSKCLGTTIQAIGNGGAAAGGLNIVNCLFQGLAQKFCADIVVSSPYSIVGGLNIYFTSFQQRVAQSAVKLVTSFIVVAVFGVILTSTWMVVLTMFGHGLIWFSIIATLTNITVLMIINFVILNIPVGVVLLVYLVFKLAWYAWTWRKIKFAANIMEISLKFLRRSPQPFFLATALFIWNAGWCLLFAAAYLDLYSPSMVVSGQAGAPIAIFLLVLGFFWSYEVWKGCMVTSIAGTFATWYYFRMDGDPSRHFKLHSSVQQRGTDAQLRSPMFRSFLQTITRSFGTVIFSSLLLALLKTFHYWYRRSKNSRNVWVRVIVNALLSCLESILRVFNLYALVRVGVQHEAYCEAAKNTWGLIKERGVEALVNDDCVDTVTGGGRWIGAVSLAVIGFISSKISHHLDWDISLMVTVVSFFIGFSMFSIFAAVVEAASVTLFVLLAEHPHAMLMNHPYSCRKLVEVVIERCEAQEWEVPPEIKQLAAETAALLSATGA